MSGARTVAGYWPIKAEVDLIAVWHELHAGGTAVCLPRLQPGTSASMEFVPWEPTVPMAENRFAIPEPPGPASPMEALDVVVMPCTAVDDSGTRVGMGAGFYDRALGSFTETTPPGGAAGLAPHSDSSTTSDPTELIASGSLRPTLVCVAFESQLVHSPGSIERRSWDVPADIVVTESRVLTTDAIEPRVREPTTAEYRVNDEAEPEPDGNRQRKS